MYALEYARHLEAQFGNDIFRMGHSPDLRDLEQGENLYASTGGGWQDGGADGTRVDGSQAWYEEESGYNYANPG